MLTSQRAAARQLDGSPVTDVRGFNHHAAVLRSDWHFRHSTAKFGDLTVLPSPAFFYGMKTNEEIAVALNISVQEVTNIMLCAGSVTSLDVQLEDEDSVSLKDIIPDSTYNPEEMFMKKYTHDCMLEVMSDLKETERDILVKRYNLQNDGSNYTLKSIGNQYGVSAETIRQVELRALRKLKLKSEELKELAYC